jgi:NTP pyrophosphatase (non-canonical NTP hydrolase)
MVAHKHLPIWRDAQRLTMHLHEATTKAPREMRYTLVQRLLSESVEVSVAIANANRAKGSRRKESLGDVLDHLVRINILLQVALQQRCLSRRSAAHAIEMLDTISKQAHGWERSTIGHGKPELGASTRHPGEQDNRATPRQT